MRDCKITKKALSVLLALSMVLSWTPIPTHAADVDTCTHHAEHTADCGYVAAVAGSPCTHVHDEACGYAEAVAEVLCACVPGEDGVLVHNDGCGYVAPVAAADCTHAHDAACGYIAASEGAPCTYECGEDHGTVTDQPEATTEPSVPETTEGETVPETTKAELVCTCGTDDPAIHATDCAVYVRPENPQCFCTEKCTEINVWCDVCGFDYTQCGGTDTAAVYADCAHTTVTDGICTGCKLYGWCGAPETEGGAVTDNVIWTLTQNNEDNENPTYTLILSGTGETAAYSQVPGYNNSDTPWGLSDYNDLITKVVVNEGITGLSYRIFGGMPLLNSFELPTTVTTLNGTFIGCTSLTSITIPEHITEIGLNTFASCNNIRTINWPSSGNLKTIGRMAFNFLYDLKSVIIPRGVEKIDKYAFNESNLEYLEIPATVTEINYPIVLSATIVKFLGQAEPEGLEDNNFYEEKILVPCTYSGTTFCGNTVTIGHFEEGTGKSNLSYTAQGNVITQHCSYCGETQNATATLTVADDLTYDGTNKVKVDYTAGWLGGKLDVIEAIHPGTYTASITCGGVTASTEEFTITKAPLTITAKDQTITYGGNISAGVDQISGDLATGDSFCEVTLTTTDINVTENGTITPSAVKIVNTSGEDVTANYIITYETGKLIINKSEPVITFNAEYAPSKTYDNEAVNAPTVENITVSTKYDGNVIFTWYKDSVSEDNKLDAAPKDAGTYILLASIAETENNNAATKELTVTISKAPASVTEAPTAVSGLIYTGAPQKLVSGGKVEGGTLVYSTTETGTYAETVPTGTDAGSYEVWYKVRGDANHTDTEPVKLSIIVIAQADASNAVVTVTGTYSYTSAAIIPTAEEVFVTLGGKTLTYDKDYTFEASNNIEVGTDTAIVTVTFKGNYTGTATGKFTIIPCPHSEFEDKKCTQCGGACGDENVVDHDYDNGICVNGCYQPAELVDGVYQIGNAGQLYWFAGLVNGTLTDVVQNRGAKAVLTADISMPINTNWTPIGSNDFGGVFDGQNHTISNLNFSDSSANNVGLFGQLLDGSGAVYNVGLLNVDLLGSNNVGGVTGVLGDATIENCYVTGRISGENKLGGLVGYASGGIVADCHFYGEVGTGTNAGEIIGLDSGATCINCYYLADSVTHDDSVSGTTAKTSAQFASGEVAYLLQVSQSTQVWGQTIGTDGYPVLGGAKVYQVTDCKGGTNGYSNDSTATGVHNYVNGTCTICGDTIELISVDITWGAMEFTYTDGAWNAETHSYGEGSWSSKDENGEDTGWVEVHNSGNVQVTATVKYENATGFDFTAGWDATSVALDVGGKKKFTLTLEGKPEKALDGETIGTVTVTIGR